MTELTFTLLRLGFLVLLWVFVLSAIGVLRRDLYGTKIAPARKKGRRFGGASAGKPGGRPNGAPRAGNDSGAQAPAPHTPSAPAPHMSTRRGSADFTKLVVTSGPLRGVTIPLSSSPILIGRAPNCTLVLDDDYSSSRHAQIFGQGGAWFVEDLGSTNGTFVGDQRVSTVTPLGPGSVVRIGQSTVELQR